MAIHWSPGCLCCEEPSSSSSSSSSSSLDPCECNSSRLRVQATIDITEDEALANNPSRFIDVVTSCGLYKVGNAKYNGLSGTSGTYNLDLDRIDPCVPDSAVMYQSKDYFFLGTALTTTFYNDTAGVTPGTCDSTGSIICANDSASRASWVRLRHTNGDLIFAVQACGTYPGVGGTAPPFSPLQDVAINSVVDISCSNNVFPKTYGPFDLTVFCKVVGTISIEVLAI